MGNKDSGKQDLFRRIAESDEKAFAVFFDQYHTRLLRYANLFVQSIAEAEDVVSDVLIKLVRNRREIFLKENVVGYLFQCIKNQCLDYLKKEKKRSKIFDINYSDKDYFVFDKQTPFSQLIHTELDTLVRDRIEDLPPKRRLVYKLIKDEQMSYKEVASLMEISDRTVEVHLKLALKEIREAIEAYMNQSGLQGDDQLRAAKVIALLIGANGGLAAPFL